MTGYHKPCCWVCGKEVPRYDLDKRKGTCGDFRCLAYRRRENMFLLAIVVGAPLLFVGFIALAWLLA